MAATSQSISRIIHSQQFPDFRKPLKSSNCISLSSQNPFLGNLTFSFINPSSTRTSQSLSISTKRRPVSAAITVSLPTVSPNGVVGDKTPKWSGRAIKSFAMSELEARKLKYPTTGTEALLMGVLIEGTSPASRFLRENGITLTKVKEESIKLLGKGDLYFFSPEHPPLTESAQRALDWALNQKVKSDENGVITTIDLLLGIWSEEESPGHKILAALGFDDEKANKLKSIGSKPGFDEDK
ncbi:ATP-dependent Clp protease ATP-binding subunit CLPT2, chloroplastic-like [Chenopodium quinoa]|uniref:Clp R domain-containing protein n=1 Tax=Chenopodium quinoa TaxID=63459 RepID=A0A803LQZ1_CHEQI|nr:ATP-dependent Clp protease ATP-binding subunit CLPT2, chloroplastic-like [Chenopodium quinoa]